ncbi:MAG: hypothetical protein INR72_15230, partial [Williamsia herbipolensis]|nr:hypothetical protein [Williamsia herbipolensis]
MSTPSGSEHDGSQDGTQDPASPGAHPATGPADPAQHESTPRASEQSAPGPGWNQQYPQSGTYGPTPWPADPAGQHPYAERGYPPYGQAGWQHPDATPDWQAHYPAQGQYAGQYGTHGQYGTQGLYGT